MAGGRSSWASSPGNSRVSRKATGATSGTGKRRVSWATTRKRTVVLDGTFSIEEIEVKGTSRLKVAKTTKKRPSKKVARTAKRAARPKTSNKPATVELGQVALASRPGIKNIAELKKQLTAAYSAGSVVVVDAGMVESIDTAALQLLVAFANSVRQQSRAVEWKEPSTVFREMADLTDLTQQLGIGDGCVTEQDDGLCPVF